MNTRVQITKEMLVRAEEEAKKRDKHIHHHFDSDVISKEERDVMGFLGEFAFCSFLGLDWESNIRKSYDTIDSFDVYVNHKRIDVKTNSIPSYYFRKILNGKLGSLEPYSRGLINENQVKLLSKYDYVFFGIFQREDWSYWYPLGYLPTKNILLNYEVIKKFGNSTLPYPAIAIPHQDLRKYPDRR